MVGGYAAAMAGGAVLLVATPLAIYGVSRAIRAGKEKEIKQAMTACMAENGHPVSEWKVARKPKPKAGS
jgi:hypothetical protein